MSQPTRSVRLLLAMNQIPYDFEIVDAIKGDNRKMDFKSQFPNGLVPVIDDSGHKVEESANILTYLCNKNGLDQFYPIHPYARSKVDFWLHWHHSNARSSTRMLLHPKLFPKLPDAENRFIAGQKQLSKVLTFMDSQLDSRPFLADMSNCTNLTMPSGEVQVLTEEQCTIADLMVITEFDQHLPGAFDLIDYSPYKNVQRWMKDLADMPAYQEVYSPLPEMIQKYKKW